MPNPCSYTSTVSRFRAEAVTSPGLGPEPLSRRGVLGAVACICGAFSTGGFAGGGILATAAAATLPLHGRLDDAARAIEAQMIEWRRDFHQNPELGNQEVRTAGRVASHLKRLGYTVREGVAVTGVVGTLRGGAGDGPVVALRADMDALPVAEEVELPFASRAKAKWDGVEVPVMHACGHDCHIAILMAVAEVLAAQRAALRGTVKLVFQPAEENLPRGEIGGAKRMLAEGAFADPKPDAVLGLHVISRMPAGSLAYRAGPAHASADEFRITMTGRQTHGARPWLGVDPIVIGAQIVTALQTIQSRQVDVDQPSVLTVGQFHAGTRNNIIPDRAEMNGTLRTFDEARRAFMQRRVTEIAEGVAKSMDGSAEVRWEPNGYPVTVNDPALTERLVPTLARVVEGSGGRLVQGQRNTAGDDFSYFGQAAPGFFFWVGVAPPGADMERNPPNHSPRFRVEESGMLTGLRATLHLVADFTGSAVG